MSNENQLAAIASDALLRKLDAQQYANHNKHVIDYLPEGARQALFRGLVEHAQKQVQVRLEGTVPTSLDVVPRKNYELLPFLVVDDAMAGGKETNVGTEGFASSLRDFFSEGATKHRVLLVLTSAGNETQRSARDAADKELISLRAMCEELAHRYGLGENAVVGQIVDVFLDYTTKLSWSERLGRLDNFLTSIHGRPQDDWGNELHRLGCFFSDSAADYATHRIPALKRSVMDRRIGERSRLRTNGAAFLAMTEVFNDPLQPDTREGLGKLVDGASANRANTVGASELGGLDFAAVREPAGSNRTKNKFVIEDEQRPTTIIGVHHHHWLPGTDNRRILVVATGGPFSIHVPLAHEHNPQHENLRLISWRKGKYTNIDVGNEVADDDVTALFNVPCDALFEVFRVALSKGPRSYKSFDDDFFVVVYKSDHPSVAWEVGAQISMEHQSWVREGNSASFKIANAGGETTRETVHLDSFEYDPSDAPTDSREIDSVITAVTDGVHLGEGTLQSRICWTESVTDASEDIHSLLETAIYQSGMKNDARTRLFQALRTRKTEGQRYLDAITDSTRDPSGFWNLELGSSVRLRCQAYNDHGQEEAVGKLLDRPDAMRLESSDGEFDAVEFPELPELHDLLRARTSLFNALSAAAVRHTETEGERSFVSLQLTNLAPHADHIDAYLEAWNKAFDAAASEKTPFSPIHEALLHQDAMVYRDSEGRATAVSVLPTHPWVLRSLLSFQRIADEAYQRSSSHADLRKSQITRQEFEQLAATKVVEHWYFENIHLRAEDGAPFTFDYVPVDRYVSEARLDYVSRVVRKKIDRYLQMHAHLRNARRTLRIAFVNPGDAGHLFAGISEWLKNSKPRDEEEYEGWLARTPQIEVLLFEPGDERRGRSNEFDRFFREHLDSSNIKELDQVLLTKLRYGKRRKSHPDDQNDYVHLCFVHGLVKNNSRKEIQGDIAAGWDGCFADGLMATNIRRTEKTSVGGERLVSQRGLWIGSQQNSRRVGLANLLTLLRGAKTGEVTPGGSVFTQVELPGLVDLEGMYENSDWVIHLDRELSLELFRRWGNSGPKIIEYSDQEDPLSPGFDVITVTQHAKPYYEQLDSVLKYASLTPENTMSQDELARAKTEGEGLLEEINTLSGSWALDFLMGSIAQPRFRTRLVGNVGSALVFRWLRRVEEDALKLKYGKQVVPVYISLEEIIRATPAAGLPTRDGMKHRYSSESSAYCDDLLVLYLTPAAEGQEYKIFGRIIEVKFGTSAMSQEKKAIDQVKGTHKLLHEHLSGDRRPLEAPFRHRQLSLLIKSQLEQAVSSGILEYERMDALNLSLLSAKLASGDYTVDYTLGEDDRMVYGDALLLTTSGEVDAEDIVRTNNGVRIVTLDRNMLHWLAYTNAPTPAVPIPRNTLPELGKYNATLKDLVDGRWESKSTLDDHESEAGVVVWGGQGDLVGTDQGDLATVKQPTQPGRTETHRREPDVSSPEDAKQEVPPVSPPVSSERKPVSLEFASRTPVRDVTRDTSILSEILDRLVASFEGQGIKLSELPSGQEIELGPRLIRVHVRLDPSEKISSVRNRSEDIARNIGTVTNDIHIVNVPEKRAIALDLPIPGLEYQVNFHHLSNHMSFAGAQRELALGFCAGIDLTGKPIWVDLAAMPHMMVAGTTGSGKTVFLRTLILTLMLHHAADELDVRLASSKPMDFLAFMDSPHTRNGELATNAEEAHSLVRALVDEMERRIVILTQAKTTSLGKYNAKVAEVDRLPRIVAVIDEFSETVLSMEDPAMRKGFETSVARLAQKARAAGIHLVLCMQRPDANVVRGTVKANILHRFALKLPTKTDSQVILDENGAEALLGQGDLLYKDASSKMIRLQVPFLDDDSLEELIETL